MFLKMNERFTIHHCVWDLLPPFGYNYRIDKLDKLLYVTVDKFIVDAIFSPYEAITSYFCQGVGYIDKEHWVRILGKWHFMYSGSLWPGGLSLPVLLFGERSESSML